MLQRKLRKSKTNYSDYDSAPRDWNRLFRRIARRRENREWKKDNGDIK